MKIRDKVLNLLLTALLLPGPAAAAQGTAVGTFQSFKGMGFTVETVSRTGREFNTFTLYADLARAYLGEGGRPGVKLAYSHNIRIAEFTPATLDDLSLVAGSGVSAGLVQDVGKEVYGLCGALSGTIGTRAAFPCGVCLTLGLTVETGLLFYQSGGQVKSTLYRDGIFQTVLPHLTISYLFR